jgi:hypothetical protein
MADTKPGSPAHDARMAIVRKAIEKFDLCDVYGDELSAIERVDLADSILDALDEAGHKFIDGALLAYALLPRTQAQVDSEVGDEETALKNGD